LNDRNATIFTTCQTCVIEDRLSIYCL